MIVDQWKPLEPLLIRSCSLMQHKDISIAHVYIFDVFLDLPGATGATGATGNQGPTGGTGATGVVGKRKAQLPTFLQI